MIIDSPYPVTERNPFGKAFDKAFILELVREFDLEAKTELVAERLHEIAWFYGEAKQTSPEEERAWIAKHRKEYEKLARKIAELQDELARFRPYGIDIEIFFGAEVLSDFDPKLDLDDYPSCVYKPSIPYDFELQRYLNFLQIGVHDRIQRIRKPVGKPKNDALYFATHRIYNLWALDLGREYTLNYHQGVGSTEAFFFTNQVLQKLEPFPERQIVSMMRSVQKDIKR